MGNEQKLGRDQRIEDFAAWLHENTRDLEHMVGGYEWPLHDNDDGYRGGGGYVRLIPKDIAEHHRDLARRAAEYFAKQAALASPAVGDGWRPIAEADKDIAYVHVLDGGNMRIGGSYPVWARDEDGRVFEALWSDNGKRSYWWDIEGESPVDPVEFMPHPLDPRFLSTSPSLQEERELGRDLATQHKELIVEVEQLRAENVQLLAALKERIEAPAVTLADFAEGGAA